MSKCSQYRKEYYAKKDGMRKKVACKKRGVYTKKGGMYAKTGGNLDKRCYAGKSSKKGGMWVIRRIAN